MAGRHFVSIVVSGRTRVNSPHDGCQLRYASQGLGLPLHTQEEIQRPQADAAFRSTITLTMDHYTHLGIVDLVAGLKRLPVMAGNGAGAEAEV